MAASTNNFTRSWRLSHFKKIISPGKSLKWRTVQGTVVVLAGDGYLNFIRLAGNLLMTRLLYPEAFGLMLIVNLFYTALNMLSDAGIHTAVIVKSKGRESEFINTAWTLTVLRGLLLMVAGLLLSYPISLIYNEPKLYGLVAATSVTALIGGFSSPHAMIYDRDVKKVPVIAHEVLAATLALAATLSWLFVYPTIWALVGHIFFSSIFKVLLSYYFFKGPIPGLELNRKVVKEIFGFGKWIFISTALAFLSTQGDKAIISNWISAEQLGVFSIAIALAKITETISGSVNTKLLLPVYSELDRSDNQKLAKSGLKVRVAVFLICAPLIVIFSTMGDFLIGILYDSRYHNAGWMLQIIALGTVFSSYNDTMGSVVLAKGRSYQHMWLQAYRSISLICIMLLGGYIAGFSGLIYSIALAPAIFYPVLTFYTYRIGAKGIKYDLFSIIIIVTLVLSYWTVTSWPSSPNG